MSQAVASPVSADPLLSDPEATAYLNVAKGTLAAWRCTRRYAIPFARIGRSVKYRKSALDQFIASRTVGAAITSDQA